MKSSFPGRWSFSYLQFTKPKLPCDNLCEFSFFILGHPKYLDEFTYQDSDINDVILMCMSNLSLIGVSGRFIYRGAATPVTRNIKIERVLGKRGLILRIYQYLMVQFPRR